MKLSVLAIFVLIIASCGRSPTGRGPASSLLGSEQSEVSNLSGIQKNIAVNLCFELKSKNILWRNNLLNTSFVFDVEEDRCDVLPTPLRTVNTTLKGPLNSEAMVYDTQIGQTAIPYPQVATDAQGDIATLCTKLMTEEPASNTASYSDGSTVQYIFYQKSAHGFDGFSTLYFRSGETVAWKEIVTEIELSTDSLPNANYKGIESVVRKRETCPSGDTASIIQTYRP